MSVYIVDSNFFIQAHRDSYPLDVASSFWSKVKMLADNGTLVSIDKVRNELYDKNDALEAWCRSNLPDNFFRDSSNDLNFYTRVTSWAHSKRHITFPSLSMNFLMPTRPMLSS